MRYKESGELHLDFHGTAAATINYILKRFGKKKLQIVIGHTARKVYRSIYEHLKQGNTQELLEHWQYFFSREKGVFRIIMHDDGRIELLVTECPAVRQVKALGMDCPDFCLQTKMLNDSWSEGTPFIISTEKLGEGACRQTIVRR